jgi:peptide/nickel transport system substrate-binding protein
VEAPGIGQHLAHPAGEETRSRKPPADLAKSSADLPKSSSLVAGAIGQQAGRQDKKLARALRLSLAIVAAGILVAAILWMARSPGPGAPPAPPGQAPGGGSLVSSIRSEPRSFNRYSARDSVTETFTHLTQAKLLRVDRRTQEIEPWLAEGWDASPDGLTYTLRLRKGVQFSDGAPFSSADVLFAFRAIYDERTGSPTADSMRVDGKPLQVSAPDESTVIVKFPAPFGPGVRLLDNLPILPRHRLEQALQAGTLAQAWGPKTPPSDLAGLGPFVLREYQPGQRLVFTRNLRYWRKDASGVTLPYLDRLTLEIVPDQNAELLRLQTGQVDFTQSEIRAEDYAALKRAADTGRLVLHDLGVGLDPDSFWFNLDPASKAADPHRPWLRRVELRQAISRAVDRKAFVDTVFLGAAVPVSGPVTAANRRWYVPDLPTFDYTPAEARTLLESLELTDRNGDGTLEDAAGRPARFTLVTQKGNSALERGSAVIRDDLARVGLKVDVVPLEVGALIDRLERGDYEAVYFRFLTTDFDPALNLDFWLSRGGAHVWHPGQERPATEWERRIDELMKQQVASLDDQRRKALFADVQRIFAEQLPILHFAAPRVLVATSARVLNATPAVLRPAILWNPDTLAVKPDRAATTRR